MKGISLALGRPGLDDCPAWDPDGTGVVRIADLVLAVAAALHGCSPAPPDGTATETATASATSAPVVLPDFVAQFFTAVCPSTRYMSHAAVVANSYTLRCETVGHYTDIGLTSYATHAEADEAFRSGGDLGQPYPFHELPAVYSEIPFEDLPGLGGAHRNFVWRLGCWIVGVHSFDDTSYRIAPQVVPVSETLYADFREDLLSRCAPTPSPTPSPSPTPREALFAAVAEPFEAACSPFGILGSELAYETTDGFWLFCRPTAGHEHQTELRRYATTAAAIAAYEEKQGDLGPERALDGVVAAYGERPFHYSGTCVGNDCGRIRELVWRLDCWVATMRSSDDTHFILALDPLSLSQDILASAGEQLRGACE